MSNDFFLKKLPLINIAEISLKAFKKNFRYILLIGLLIVVPFNVVLLLIPFPTAVDLQNYIQNATAAQDVQSLYALPEIKNIMQYLYSIFAATVIFNPLSTAACAYLAKQHITDKKPDFPGLIDSSIGKWGKHITTSLVYNVFVGLSFVLVLSLLASGIGALFGFVLIVPTVILGVGLSFGTIITATTDKWAFNALKESHRIMKNQISGAIGFLILSSVLSYFTSVIFVYLLDAFEPLLGSFASEGIGATLYYFFGSIISDTLRLVFQVFTAVWFFNRLYAFERINS